MENKNYFTTGEVIDLIKNDKELIFEAVSGMYDGQVISYHSDMEWLMWKDDNTYLPITLNGEFMGTKWKILGMQYAYLINVPISDNTKVYINYQ